VVTLTGLYIYPVKSCRGIAVDDWLLEDAGLERDREWMVVTPDGRFLTQRELPQLALVVPTLEHDHLALDAPGMPRLVVPYEGPVTAREVVVWRSHLRAHDSGEAAAQWLSDYLGRPLRLVQFDRSERRLSSPEFAGDSGAITRFSDGYALLAISQASLDDLNSRLPQPLPVNRFRPNLVLDGLPPYGEDDLRDLRVGAAHLRCVTPCTRCVITTTHQATGELDGVEPLRTLKTYRWEKKLHGVIFGQNVIVITAGAQRLTRGMHVVVG
jgi:uncharacterized protein YcbX